MPAYFALGFVALVFILYALRWLTRIDPAALATLLRYFAIAALVLGVLLLFVVGRGGLIFVVAGLGYPLWQRWRSRRAFQRASTASPRSSTVQSKYLVMSLEHEHGTIDGSVKFGRFAGRRLGDLGLADLQALLQEIRPTDSEGVTLLEAYLDRVHPDWRGGKNETGAGASGGPMSREEAFKILGLRPDAGEAEIREAHHRLMLKLHPDHGGSDYLAARLNEARDVLLGS